MTDESVKLLKKMHDCPSDLTSEEKEYVTNSNYKFLIARAVECSNHFSEEDFDKIKDKIINNVEPRLACQTITRNFKKFDDIDFELFLDRILEEDPVTALKFISFLATLNKKEIIQGKVEIARENIKNKPPVKIYKIDDNPKFDEKGQKRES